MRKIISLSILTILASGMDMQTPTRAAAEEFPTIETIAEMYSGFRLVSDSTFERTSYPGVSGDGTHKASEFWGDDNGLLLGGKIEAHPFPQRFFLEADIEGNETWFAEAQHSYKDLTQFRVISKRFEHNLDNTVLYNLGGQTMDRRDVGKDYSLTVDMDEFKLRLKTPNFPFHLYTTGQLIHRDGERQQRFYGTNLTRTGTARVSESRDIDQETRDITLGANSHLGYFEADLSHTWEEFTNDASDPVNYYNATASNSTNFGGRAAGYYIHNQYPDIKSDKTTFKVHTTQTGQVFGSATLVDLDRENETSQAEDESQLGHTELMWTPRGNLTFGAKFRHLDTDTGGPDSVDVGYLAANGTPKVPAEVEHGMESTTSTGLAFFRYAPLSKLTLKGQYSMEHRERDEELAAAYYLPETKDTDTLDLGAVWRVHHDLRMSAKYIYKDLDIDSGSAEEQYFNPDPERSHQYSADVTYTPNEKTSLLASALWKTDKADNLQIMDEAFEPADDGATGYTAHEMDALLQRYMLSAAHSCTERVTVTGTYVYSNMDMDRDLALAAPRGTAASNRFVDQGYNDEQKYHTFSLSTDFQASDRLGVEFTADYTIATDDYSVTNPTIKTPLDAGEIANSDSHEFGLQLDSEYALLNNWKAGILLRYVNWIDKSFDNPNDAEMVGGLLKLTKVFK